MNKLMKKAAALLTAGLMAAASLSAEAFAESTKAVRSESVTVAYEATVAKPTYTIKGTAGERKIRLSTTTSGATIYYTTNGTVPTTKSRKYTNGTLLKITKDIKIKAIAVYGSSQSAVMTKTFKVATKCGDITGDGNINSNDLARFKNYAAGKTSYICKDNADCNGDGKITTADVTILSQFLDGTIKALPYRGAVQDEEEDPEEPENNSSGTTTTTTLAKPGITVYKSMGGKKVEFTSSTSGVSFYYTLDGTTPTTKSTKYNGMFLIDTAGTKTVKVIAYKNGATSAVQQTTVTVGTTSAVTSLTSTSTYYDGSATIILSCPTADATIFYTTDGTNPRTSSTARTYTAPFNITESSTVGAYARSKANADSTATYFNFTVRSDFAISGTVWNDTPTNTSVADGLRASNEAGISGITVRALNVQTNTYVRETTTDSSGNYTLSGLVNGTSYKIAFEFNGQKYRPYTSVVNNGNQALLTGQLPALTIRNSGAYGSTNTIVSNINSYSAASTNAFFNTTATTSSSYTASTQNVNCALSSLAYGLLSMSVTSSGQYLVAGAANPAVKNGDRLTYTVTLTNNSPSQDLSDVTLGLYMSDYFTNIIMLRPDGTAVSSNFEGSRSGYRYYTISNLLGSAGLAAGKSVSFTFVGYVSATKGTKLNFYTEVTSYRFANSVYDMSSVPGNLTIGSVREKDEAEATVIEVIEDTSATTSATISASGTKPFTILPPPTSSMPSIRPRLELMSPMTSPMYSSGVVTTTFMMGSSSVAPALAQASLKAILPQILKAISEESTSWN